MTYHPANLNALGDRKMPILVWGNGSCSYIGNRFRYFLTEIASHGYLALAGGPMGPKERETITMASNNPTPAVGAPRAGSGTAAAVPPAAPAAQREVTVDLLRQGITWAIAENTRSGSKFFGKLDTNAVAVMGQSCGARLAGSFGNDPRVKTVGMWMGSNPDMIGGHKVPVLLHYGRRDVRHLLFARQGQLRGDQQRADLLRMARQAAAPRHLPAAERRGAGPHCGGLAPVAVARRSNAARMFKGADCTLCRDPNWHAQKKRID